MCGRTGRNGARGRPSPSTSLSLRWFGASVPAIGTAMPSPISHCAVRGRVLSMRSLANEPVLGLSALAGRFAVIRVRPEVLLSHPCHLLRSSFERVCDVVHWIHRQPAYAIQRTWIKRHTSRVGLAAQALVLDDDTEGLHLAVPRIVIVGSCLGLKSSASRKGRRHPPPRAACTAVRSWPEAVRD